MSNIVGVSEAYRVRAIKEFTKNLIAEYNVIENRSDMPYLWTRELYSHDRKILLSYACDAEMFEYYLKSLTTLEIGFEEHDELIQGWLDKACAEIHREVMEENAGSFSSGIALETERESIYAFNRW